MRLTNNAARRRVFSDAGQDIEALEPRAMLAVAGVSSPFTTFPDPHATIVADLNNDGRADLVIPTATGFQVRYKRPSGLEAVFDVAVPGSENSRYNHLAVGHFDGDARLDVAISTEEVNGPIGWTAPGTIQVYSGRAGGVFRRIGMVTAKGVVALSAGNFDGDGRDELIAERVINAAHTPTTMEVRRYVMDGSAQGVRSGGQIFQWTGIVTAPLVADVDGDGQTDVLIGVRAGAFLGDANVRLFRGQGDGTFVQNEVYRFASHTAIQGLAIGDVDGDGHTDIAIVSWNGTTTSISYLAAQSDGSFTSPTARVLIADIDPLLPVNSNAVGVALGSTFAIGDFDHDGHPDIRVQVSRTLDLTQPGQRPVSGKELFKINFENDGMGGFASRVELISVE